MTLLNDNLPMPHRGFWAQLPRPIIGLAPMDGVTDAAFRLVVAQQGRPDVIFTEFTSVMDICRGPGHLLSSLFYSELERPVVAQLYGKDPALFYQAAHIVCELGFDGLDINMGCPSHKVAHSGSGAGLIRTPDVAQAIMRAARQGIQDWAAGQSLTGAGLKESRAELIRAMKVRSGSATDVLRKVIPLSVKTRIGYDAIIVEEWISHLVREQPVAISVHGRTLEQMYRGAADWSAIERAAQLVRGTGTILLGNGDLHSLQEAAQRIRAHGVDGVLVGRSALGSPGFFKSKEAARALSRGEMSSITDDSATREERFRMMLDHARQFEALFGLNQFPRMRKHLGWYCKGFPHAAALRGQMVRASSSDDVVRMIADFPATTAYQADPAASTMIPA